MHIIFVVLTISGFIMRGIWAFYCPDKLQQKWVRFVPHVNDSLLFFSGVALVVIQNYMPWHYTWLQAKLLLLLVYIILGHIVLSRRELPKPVRFISWLLALLVVAYMIAIARNKQVVFW